MLNHEIWYNGKSSRDAGVRHIEHFPQMDRPERKVETFDVPGRNGLVVFPSDSFNGIVREYDIYAGEGTRESAPSKFGGISEWLNSAGGKYARLEDTFEPDVFRLAYCLGGYDAESAFNRFGRATISFYCRPERFLKSGEDTVTMSPGDTLYNPTGYASSPLIYCKVPVGGTASHLVLESGGETFHLWFNTAPTRGMFIDCESMDVYGDDGVNYNSWVSIGDFPKFYPGETKFVDNNLFNYHIDVIPRWFEI